MTDSTTPGATTPDVHPTLDVVRSAFFGWLLVDTASATVVACEDSLQDLFEHIKTMEES